MKFFLVLAAILGLTLAAPSPAQRDLGEDLDRILASANIDGLKELLTNEAKTNGDLIISLDYLQNSAAFDQVQEAFYNHPNWKILDAWLAERGVDADDILNRINIYVDGVELGTASGDGNLNTFLEAVLATVVTDELITTVLEVVGEDALGVLALYEEIKSENTHVLVNDLLSLAEVQRIIGRLLDMNVDVRPVLIAVYDILGWGVPPGVY